MAVNLGALSSVASLDTPYYMTQEKERRAAQMRQGQAESLELDRFRLENQMLGKEARIAGQTLAPDPKSYTQAANIFEQKATQGLQGAQQQYGSAVNLINQDLSQARQALQSGYGQGRTDLQQNYQSAIDRWNVVSKLAPEAIGEYANRVLSPFDQQFASYQQSPAYQFGLSEGMKGIQALASSQGSLNSGATMKAMQRYATDYAAHHYMSFHQMQVSEAQQLAQFTATGVGSQAALQAQQGESLAASGAAQAQAEAAAQQQRGALAAGVLSQSAQAEMAQRNLIGEAQAQGVLGASTRYRNL